MKSLFEVALESEKTDGVKVPEIEYVLYAKLADASILKKATAIEEHEQWEIKIPKTHDNAAAGRIRVRKTTEKSGVTYAQTVKCKLTKANGDQPRRELEITTEATEHLFDEFALMSSTGMHKRRYTLPLSGTKYVWEVDRFIQADGSESLWCKIDLEVQEPLDQLPSLPSEFTEVISGVLSVEDQAKVSHLYETVFLKKNPHIQPIQVNL